MNRTNLSILALATVFFTSCYYDNFKELHPDAALTVSNCDSTGVTAKAAIEVANHAHIEIVPKPANSLVYFHIRSNDVFGLVRRHVV